MRPGNELASSWMLVRFANHRATAGAPEVGFKCRKLCVCVCVCVCSLQSGPVAVTVSPRAFCRPPLSPFLSLGSLASFLPLWITLHFSRILHTWNGTVYSFFFACQQVILRFFLFVSVVFPFHSWGAHHCRKDYISFLRSPDD